MEGKNNPKQNRKTKATKTNEEKYYLQYLKEMEIFVVAEAGSIMEVAGWNHE